nr:MAG TPA: hypothetical protein [Bacteriophage sp.]
MFLFQHLYILNFLILFFKDTSGISNYKFLIYTLINFFFILIYST